MVDKTQTNKNTHTLAVLLKNRISRIRMKNFKEKSELSRIVVIDNSDIALNDIKQVQLLTLNYR